MAVESELRPRGGPRSSVFGAHPSTKFGTFFLAGLLLSVAAGCIPLIPEDEFLSRANDFALSPELTCEQLRVDFGVPDLPTVNDPSELGIAFEEASVTTSNNQTLRVWYIPAEPDRGTVLLTYGGVGEMRCYLLLTKYLHADGWSMVMFDLEGFGGSTGQPSLSTLVIDHNAVLDWTLARTGRPQVTLMGVSVGTIPSVAQAAARPVVPHGTVGIRAEVDCPVSADRGGRIDQMAIIESSGPKLPHGCFEGIIERVLVVVLGSHIDRTAIADGR